MKKSDAVTCFGSLRAVAEAANVTRQASEKWGRVIPLRTARWLELYSNGAVKVDPSCYKRGGAAKTRPSIPPRAAVSVPAGERAGRD
jgi:hypothetical protein